MGKANCDSTQARETMGKHGKKPVVHYDYLYREYRKRKQIIPVSTVISERQGKSISTNTKFTLYISPNGEELKAIFSQSLFSL